MLRVRLIVAMFCYLPDLVSAPSFASYSFHSASPVDQGTQNYTQSAFSQLIINDTNYQTGVEYTAYSGQGNNPLYDNNFGTITLSGSVPNQFRLGFLIHNNGGGNPYLTLDLSSAADSCQISLAGASAGDTILISSPKKVSGAVGQFGGITFDVIRSQRP